jgi:hypothetical protein
VVVVASAVEVFLRVLAAVGAVNRETNDLAELAFLGFSSVVVVSVVFFLAG